MERIILSPRSQESSPRKKSTRIRKVITVNGTKSTLTEIIPSNPTHPISFLHIPGWGMGEIGYESFTESLAQRGYTSLFVTGLHKRRGITPEGFSNIHKDRALNTSRLLQMEAVPEINIVAHSEGAIVAALMALHSPEQGPKVKNLILVSPAGLTGKISGHELGLRFALHSLRTMKEDREFLSSTEGRHMLTESTRRMLRHPIIALREVHAIAESRIEDVLRLVHEKGINVAIIQGDDDTVFPLGKMEQNAEKTGIARIYVVPKAKHSAIYRDPNFPDFVDFVLSDLELNRR